jgi:hypothetical protein
MIGVGAATRTVNEVPLVTVTPLTVTATGPVVAPVGTVAVIADAVQVPIVVAVVPLNVTLPFVVPKFEPPMVTEVVPAAPEDGVSVEIDGVAKTVNDEPALAAPPTVTTTLPVVAPGGTVVVIEVLLQVPTVAAVPLNFTVLVLCVAPKFVPVIVTEAPTAPEVGNRLVIVGDTVNEEGLVTVTPLTVTATGPVVAPVGTVAVIADAVQVPIVVAVVPLNVTLPFVVPKFEPPMVTEVVPAAPEDGVSVEIDGVAKTVNDEPALAAPPTVTTTLPVVAPGGTVVVIEVLLQVPTVAAVPLNFTVLVLCVAPKFVPVIVTEAPTAPEVGNRLVIVGDTVNEEGLVTVTPLTVTATGPVVAPVGTVAVIADAVQVPIVVAVVPLNVTLPFVVPKFEPEMVTEVVPAGPEDGFSEVIDGVNKTVNDEPALAAPPTVTTTLPVVAPGGTTALIEVLPQLEIDVAAVPLNFTVLALCVVPKFVPVIVTVAPTAPDVGERLVIVGVAALPTTGAQTIARNIRTGDSNEVIRDERFIRKAFLCRQYVGTPHLRIAANARPQRRSSTTQPRTSGYSSTLEVKAPGEALLQCGIAIAGPESVYR